MAGHDRYGTELTHGAGIAKNDSVQQAPLDIGQRDPVEGLPAGGAQHQRRFLFLVALRLHQRYEFASDEGEGDEYGGQHDARYGKKYLDVVLVQPVAEPAVRAKDHYVDQAGYNRRDGEGQVDQGDQYVLAAKVELGQAPGRTDTEDQVQRHGDGCGDKRKPDGGEGVRLYDGRDVGFPAFLQCLRKNRQQGNKQKERQESEGGQHQQVSDPWRLQRGSRYARGGAG